MELARMLEKENDLRFFLTKENDSSSIQKFFVPRTNNNLSFYFVQLYLDFAFAFTLFVDKRVQQHFI
jgi:hypothetical protein